VKTSGPHDPTVFPIVEVEGAPFERGQSYGSKAADQITYSVEYYSEYFAKRYGRKWPELAERARAWIGAVETFDPDLLEEIRGIADGSGRTLEDILLLNGRGEIIYGNFAEARLDGCTCFAMLPESTENAHLLAGQNWDFRLAARPSGIVLRIVQPPKPTVITIVEAGQIARHGASSKGIAVFASGLGGFSTSYIGIPQPLIRRRILDSRDFSEALSVALDAKQQIAANLLLAHRDGFAIDLETTPNGHAWLYPEEGVLVHGNHYEAFSWGKDGPQYRPLGADSLYRTWRTRQFLRRQDSSEPALARIQAALSDHFGEPNGTCTHADPREDQLEQWQTLSSSILDLTTGEWLLSRGTPCDHPYEALPWNLYDGTS
jgi:isopenicillin-N N-acyltransferase-like protein